MKQLILNESYGQSPLAGTQFQSWLQKEYQSVPGGGLSYYGQIAAKAQPQPLALRAAIKKACKV